MWRFRSRRRCCCLSSLLPNSRRRQGGPAVRVLAGSFHGSPELKLSATLVNGLPVNVLPPWSNCFFSMSAVRHSRIIIWNTSLISPTYSSENLNSPGGGGKLATFYAKGFRTAIQPLTLLYTILAEQGTPFVYVKLSLKNVASSTCLLSVNLLVILCGI